MADAKACAGRVARVRAFMSERGYDAIVVRNNADLRWLTGAERTFDDEVAHTAVITQSAQWLHTDSRYYNTFQERLGPTSAWDIDEELVSPATWVAGRLVQSGARVVAIEDTVDLAFYDALVDKLPSSCDARLPRLHGDICDLRMVKDQEELALLRRAQEITDDAFDHICGFIQPGMTEQEVRVELENYMLTHGADGISFASIVATGSNGANPHAQPGQTVIQRGDLVVMDYGALYCDYHADMTRTVAVGKSNEEERRVYDVVRRANETCEAAVHPGCIGRDIHNLAVSIITEAGYGDYFKHGLGHGVGLEIHERPNLGRAWNRPVSEGSVVTVEPGIYLPGKFGIRLEDCGLVTASGYEPFGRSTHDLVVVAR